MNKDWNQQLKYSGFIIQEQPWTNKEFYANFLAQTYYFVCHSTRLLARSASHFGVDRDDLYKRFTAHIGEEDYHERAALKDLRALGYDLKDFPELSITKSFYEPQYYKIDQSKGTSLLGYILYLEAAAVEIFPSIVARLDECFGKNKTSFLRLHTEEDPDHVEKALTSIENLPAIDQEAIWQNFTQTADMYTSILLKIRSVAQRVDIAA